MALVKDKKRFNFASQIGVRRSTAFDTQMAQVQRNNEIVSRTLTDFINDSLGSTKEIEEARGRELAKTTGINYEVFEYEDADGVMQSVKLPVGYQTPESLLTTSFASLTFNEEIADRYYKKTLSDAFDIIQTEELKVKNNVDPRDTLSNVIRNYRNVTSEPLGIIAESLPKELREAYDLDVLKQLKSSESQIGTKYINRRSSYNTAKANAEIKQMGEMIRFSVIQQPDVFKERIETQVKNIEKLAAKKDPKALAWLDTNENFVKEIIQFNKDNHVYFNTDDSNELNIEQSFRNASELELLARGGKPSATLYNFNTGQNETKTFNELLPASKYSEEFRNEVGTQATSLRSALQTRASNIANEKNFSNKLDLSLRQERPYFTKAEKKQLRTKLEDVNSSEFQDLISAFLIEYPEATPDGVLTDPKTQFQFYTFMSQATGVLPNNIITPILSILDQPDKESIQQLINNPVNQLLFRNKYINPSSGKTQNYNGINYLGTITQEQEQKLYTLRDYMQSGLSSERASISFMEKYGRDFQRLSNDEIVQKYNHIIPDAEYGSKKMSTLKNAIHDEIINKLDDNFNGMFQNDPLMQGKVFSTIMEEVLTQFEYGQNIKSLDVVVEQAYDKFIQDGNITPSQFGVSQTLYNTQDFDENARYIMMYAPENYLGDMTENKEKFVQGIKNKMKEMGVLNLSDVQGGRLVKFAKKLKPENFGSYIRLMPLRLYTPRPDADQIYDLVFVDENYPQPLSIGIRFTMQELREINDN